jgi:hypothetical protein
MICVPFYSVTKLLYVGKLSVLKLDYSVGFETLTRQCNKWMLFTFILKSVYLRLFAKVNIYLLFQNLLNPSLNRQKPQLKLVSPF